MTLEGIVNEVIKVSKKTLEPNLVKRVLTISPVKMGKSATSCLTVYKILLKSKQIVLNYNIFLNLRRGLLGSYFGKWSQIVFYLL